MSQLKSLLDLSTRDLLLELCDILSELITTTEELTFVQQQELRVKAEGFRLSKEVTISGRERLASLHALENTCSVLELKSRLAILVEQKAFIIRLLDQRNQDGYNF